MARRFSDQEIVRLGGQVQYRAVEPEQRKLVSYMRQHPFATLKEARRREPHPAREAYVAEWAAHVAWEDLTSNQRKLVSKIPDEPVTTATIAYHSGIQVSIIDLRLKQQGGDIINPASLVFRASRGFYGRTLTGRRVIFYTVDTRNSYERAPFVAGFGTALDIEKAVRDHVPCPSPPCDDEDDAIVTIPLKDGYQRENLPPSEREIEA